MSIADISHVSEGVYTDTFDSGSGAFTITTTVIVTSLNKIRDVLLSCKWNLWRGLVGTGAISFPFGVPDATTPIITGINRDVCVIQQPAAPAATAFVNAGPYAMPLGATLVVEINGGSPQTINFAAGSFTADEIADEIAAQIQDAVPFIYNSRVYLATNMVGASSRIHITSGVAQGVLGWPSDQSGSDAGPTLSYYFWNSNFELTGHPNFGPNAVWIDVALIGGTLNTLAGLISGTVVQAYPDSLTSLAIRATGGGTYSDYITLTGNGTIDLVGGLTGGGWELRARSQKDYDAGSNNDTHLHAQLLSRTAQPGLEIKIYENSVFRYSFRPQYTPTGTPFYIWGNPFGLLLENYEPFHAGDTNVGNLFLFATSLWIDPVFTNAVRAWIIVRGSSAQYSIGIDNSFRTIDTLIDNGTEVYTLDDFFAFYTYFYSTGPYTIRTRRGKSLLNPARVMYTADPLLPPRIIGDLWDSFIDSDYFPAKYVAIEDGQAYQAVFTNDTGILGTVFLRWPRLASEIGAGGMPGVIKSGTVNVGGTAVSWVSGDKFSLAMAGFNITIGGVVYAVSSVSSLISLTLSSTAGTQSGVYYHN